MKVTCRQADAFDIAYWAKRGEAVLQTMILRHVYRTLVREYAAYTIVAGEARIMTVGMVHEWNDELRAPTGEIWAFVESAPVLHRHRRAIVERLRELALHKGPCVVEAKTFVDVTDRRAVRFVKHFGFAAADGPQVNFRGRELWPFVWRPKEKDHVKDV